MQIIATILCSCYSSRCHFETCLTPLMLLTFQMFSIGLRAGTANFAYFTVVQLLRFRLGFWPLCFWITAFFESWPVLPVADKFPFQSNIWLSLQCFKDGKSELTRYLAYWFAGQRTLLQRCRVQRRNLNNCWWLSMVALQIRQIEWSKKCIKITRIDRTYFFVADLFEDFVEKLAEHRFGLRCMV